MDILTGIRLIRENTFQTTREVLRLAEDEIEHDRAAIIRAYYLAARLYPFANSADRLDAPDIIELKRQLDELRELSNKYAAEEGGSVD